MVKPAHLFLILLAMGMPVRAFAQWNPKNRHWSKSHANHVRVMTWNVRDAVCSTNQKTDGDNNWSAVARIIAAVQPDVLVLQEAGDNRGNGTGDTRDTVADLTAAVDLLFNGGGDPFNDHAPVTAFVRRFAPDYSLPFVFVSDVHDGFNRNVIVSHFPFSDLNGDQVAMVSNIDLSSDAYAPGGDGGVRGVQFAEIDLPDSRFRGDLVVGNVHLKSGFDTTDFADRDVASRNIAYYIDFWFNGADEAIPDPRAAIRSPNRPISVLGPFTPVVLAGDFNEDEDANARNGPAYWFSHAEFDDRDGTFDGTDRDRSDAVYDVARHFFTNTRATIGLSAKVDYVVWQDSIATAARAFLMSTRDTPVFALPESLFGFPRPTKASAIASDHLPVIVDFVCPLFADLDADADVDQDDALAFTNCFTGQNTGPVTTTCLPADIDHDDDVDCDDWTSFKTLWTPTCPPVDIAPCASPAPATCCIDGLCQPGLTQPECSRACGRFFTDVGSCDPLTCPQPRRGACCDQIMCASDLTSRECAAAGGSYQGDDTRCAGNPCADVTRNVIITEIMYNPDSSESAPNDVEWVEIYNAADTTVDIAGWYLQDEDGLSGTAPTGTFLLPWGVVVLVPGNQTSADFQTAWPTADVVVPLLDWGLGGLNGLANSPSDTNEVLTLRDRNGTIQDQANFDDSDPWPPDQPDGVSIYLLPTTITREANDLGVNWARSSLDIDGALANVRTADFNGTDVGSPGIVIDRTVRCTTDGECDDRNVCTFDRCAGRICTHRDQTYGDVDGNGVINLFDIICIVQGLDQAFPRCSPANLDLAPCNPDGRIDLADLLAVLDALSTAAPCRCP